jgi:hypothetical protein
MTTRHALLLLGLVVAGMAAAEVDKVPLPLQLPKPFFVGTPVPVRLPHLEMPRAGPRPPFLVPRGVVNLARGAAVTGSDEHPMIGDLDYVTDGDNSGGDGTFLELGPGLQWVQLDLGARARIFAIVCWHYHAQPRAYHDVVVQVSNDPEFKKDVTTLFNNDHDNSSGLGRGGDPAYIETYEGRLIDGKGVVARFVRLYSAGNTADELNHYVEVEVYGQPAG